MAMVVKSATVYYSLTVSGSNGWFYQSTDSGATWQNVAYGLVAGLGMIMATATVTEIAQPYAAADLPKLRAVQSGDVMVLTCRGYAPRKIVRGAASTPTVPAFSISNYMPTAPAALVTSVTISNADTVGDADHPLKAWDYVVTWEDADGVESLPSLAAGQMMTRHPDRPATITWTGVSGAVRYHVYAGRNGEYGYIGSSTTTTMYDDGSIPVMSYDPPKWENPFSTDYPAVSVFHEDRLAFANTPILPATVRWSATEEYYNFDESLVVKDEDSFKRTLAEMRYEEIRGLMLIGELLVFTSEGEWSITGDGAVSYRNLQATPQSHNGCSWVEPIRVNNEALYVQSGGKEIRNLYPSSDGWQSDEISVLVNHLFKGVTVVAWAFARRPYGIIWVVLSDGKLLSLTYDRKQEVWAWARHDTAGTDKFEWVSVLQYQGRDVPWFIVNRANTRYIEDMTDRHNITGTSFCGLDSAVYYYNVTPTNSISGLSHLEGRQVYGLASGTVRGPVTVSSGVANFGGATATTWWVGLQITADIETLDYAKSKLGQKAVAEVGIETSLEDISLSATAGVSMGEDLSHLDRVEFANARQGLLTLIPSTDLNPGARAAVRLTDPVPVEIRGITRVIAEGP